jgi:hypothetical protein
MRRTPTPRLIFTCVAGVLISVWNATESTGIWLALSFASMIAFVLVLALNLRARRRRARQEPHGS